MSSADSPATSALADAPAPQRDVPEVTDPSPLTSSSPASSSVDVPASSAAPSASPASTSSVPPAEVAPAQPPVPDVVAVAAPLSKKSPPSSVVVDASSVATSTVSASTVSTSGSAPAQSTARVPDKARPSAAIPLSAAAAPVASASSASAGIDATQQAVDQRLSKTLRDRLAGFEALGTSDDIRGREERLLALMGFAVTVAQVYERSCSEYEAVFGSVLLSYDRRGRVIESLFQLAKGEAPDLDSRRSRALSAVFPDLKTELSRGIS
ncbi:hypothetical protein PINS_up016961 [Pythium insidiosum]|nr:hypothetical protein PINS_up016961 [Pythium insidiosum]